MPSRSRLDLRPTSLWKRGGRAAWAWIATTLLLSFGLAGALTVAPAASAQGAEPCRTVRDKKAEPGTIPLGDTVTVTLSYAGECPEIERKADVVMVVDSSLSMRETDGGRAGPTRLDRAKEAVRRFVDQMDPTLVQVGVIDFNLRPNVVHPLSDDYRAVKRAVSTIQLDLYTNIVDALEAGRRMAIGPGHRPDATPVIIFLTDGGHTVRNPPFSDIDGVIDQVRADGIETWTIGLDGSEAWVLRRIAGKASRYIDTPDSARLNQVYTEIAGRIKSTVLFTDLLLEDELPANMRYVNGSAAPAAFYDATRRTLIWRVDDVANAGGSVSYRVEPQEVGEWPTNVQATGTYTDGLGFGGVLRFPVPRVRVTPPDVGEGCVCRVTRDKAPAATIARALADPARVWGWNRLLDESKPGSPPYPHPEHDRPPNPRRTCLDLWHRTVPYHPYYNTVVWRAGCLIGPADRP